MAGSALVLGAVLWLLPFQDVWTAMRRMPPGLWLIVLGLFLVGHVVTAFKWWMLAARGTGVSFPLALRAHFAGLAGNLCLPGVAGGDVVRVALVLSRANDKARVAVGSVAERMIDTLAVLLLALAAASVLAASHWGIPQPLLKATLFVHAVALTGGIALAVGYRYLLDRIPAKAAAAIQHYKGRPGALLSCLCLSVGVQAGFILLAIPLAEAIGLHADTAAWFFAWSLAKIMALLPVSVSGIGVREAGLAALMAPFGADPAAVVAVGLLWQSVLLASGVPGGVALLLSARRGKPSPDGAAAAAPTALEPAQR